MPRRKTIGDKEVLEKVLQALMETGPAFTLADAAKRSGLAAPTLLQRYGSKKKLVRAAFSQDNARLAERFDAIAERGPSRERLISSLVDLARAFGDGTSMADQFVVLAEDIRDPTLGRIAAERTELIRDFIARMLPKTRIELAAAVSLIEALWHGAIVQAALTDMGDVSGHVRRSLRRLIDLIEA
jgi:TetR/AcrR family macrolide resistance operon transcriptional repressor